MVPSLDMVVTGSLACISRRFSALLLETHFVIPPVFSDVPLSYDLTIGSASPRARDWHATIMTLDFEYIHDEFYFDVYSAIQQRFVVQGWLTNLPSTALNTSDALGNFSTTNMHNP